MHGLGRVLSIDVPVGEDRPQSVSSLIQEVMELEFKEAPSKFSVLFGGDPKTFATLSSCVPIWH